MTKGNREAEKKRLVEALIGFPLTDSIKVTGTDCVLISRRDAEDLADKLIDANGVIVPPCKVGDTVYLFWDHDDMAKEYTVLGYISDALGLWIQIQYNQGGAIWNTRISEFGKTIFLSKEEADQRRRS